MRVALLGGNGGVGRWLMAVARENGDRVKILVRDRSKLPRDLGVIGVVEGDALDDRAVDATIAGTDVVFSVLGTNGFGPTQLYSRSAAHVVAAMRRHAIKRVLVLSCAGVETDPNTDAVRRIVRSFARKNALSDLAVMEETYARSDLLYTIVRPAGLTDGPRTGLYRAEERFAPSGSRSISRADVADFMHRVVVDERTLRKIAALAY